MISSPRGLRAATSSPEQQGHPSPSHAASSAPVNGSNTESGKPPSRSRQRPSMRFGGGSSGLWRAHGLPACDRTSRDDDTLPTLSDFRNPMVLKLVRDEHGRDSELGGQLVDGLFIQR